MDARALLALFEYNHLSLQKNLDGITDEEALRVPVEGGNCMNWTVGHILITRNALADILGIPPVWVSDRTVSYERRSEALCSDDALPLEDLWALYDQSQAALEDHLRTVGEDALSGRAGETRIIDQIVGLGFHEAYHSGQIGMLRRMIGREPVLS